MPTQPPTVALVTGDICFSARLFGAFRLTTRDGSNAAPSGRKPRALLACLLLAGRDGVTRDRLTGLLWSRSGEEQARASLRQTFYELRSLSAGDRPLISVDRVAARAMTDHVSTDLDALRAARSGNDATALADRVGADLHDLLSDLDGIDDAFDEWLAIERVRHADVRRSTLLSVAEAGLAAGDPAGAQRLAALLLASAPTDEAAARVAMRSHHAQGDSDGVRLTYARLETALRRDLDTAPTGETLELHRGLSALALQPPPQTPHPPVARPDPPAPPAPPTPPHDAASRPPPPSAAALPPKSKRRLFATGAALLAVLVLAAIAVGFWQQKAVPAGPRRLLVKPLAVPAEDRAAHALAGALPTDLARMLVGNDTALTVIDAGEAGAPGLRPTDIAVTGDAKTDAGLLRVDLKLRRGLDPTIVWSSSFSRPLGETAALRDEIANKLADVSICGFGGRHPAPADFDAQTLQRYLGACEQKHGDWAEAARLLEQVVAARPDFAHGWAYLAAGTSTAAYSRPGQAAALHAKALEYARRSIALDPGDGEAYFAQADALPGISRWAERMAILEAGHAADPDNSSLNGALGRDLARVGRWREAIAAVQRAVDVDPFGPVETSLLADLRAAGGSRESVERILQVGRSRFPSVGFFVRTDFRISAYTGDAKHAAAMLADPRLRLSLDPAATAVWQALLQARIEPTPANVERAVRLIREAADRSENERMTSIVKLMALNRVEDAYAVAAGLNEHTDRLQENLFANLMAPFRADPRFMTVAARSGIAAIWVASDRWPDFCEDKTLPYDCRVEARRALSPDARPLVPPGTEKR